MNNSNDFEHTFGIFFSSRSILEGAGDTDKLGITACVLQGPYEYTSRQGGVLENIGMGTRLLYEN